MTPHDEYPLFFFSPVSQWMDTQVASTHDCSKIVKNLMYFPLWSCVRTSYRLVPDEELLGHSVCILLLSLRSIKLFRVAALVLAVVQQYIPTFPAILGITKFPYFFQLDAKWILIIVLILISPITLDFEYLHICLLAFWICPENFLFIFWPSFLQWVSSLLAYLLELPIYSRY